MKTIHLFFIAIILVILTAELFLTPFINLPKPTLENNSFVYLKRHLPKTVDQETFVFLGSSAFSRDIDCELFFKNCLNLSIDGADAKVYDFLIHQYLYPIQAKKVVIELSSMVFVSNYDTLEALQTFLYPPQHFLKEFLTKGMNNNFKQAVKNQFESYFFWSHLNFLSRRERLASWPSYIYSKIFNHSDQSPVLKNEVFQNTYLHPDPERVELFKRLLVELRQREMEVHIISEPVEYEGKIDPEVITESPLMKELKIAASENQIHFHEKFRHWGLKDEMLDGLQHYLPEFIGWHTQTVMKMVRGETP